MDALQLLTKDHDHVKTMLAELEDTTERAIKTREQVFTKLRSDLEIHETIEEEIFYPALKDHPKTRDIALEGYEEHHVVDTVMGEMFELEVSDETWTAKFTVMKENLEHHIEEEEDTMFAQARQVFEQEELDALGAAMAERKEALMAASNT
ncbi:MAG: hemerythrin domain-containing protein [Actinomycetota bacterium]